MLRPSVVRGLARSLPIVMRSGRLSRVKRAADIATTDRARRLEESLLWGIAQKLERSGIPAADLRMLAAEAAEQ